MNVQQMTIINHGVRLLLESGETVDQAVKNTFQVLNLLFKTNLRKNVLSLKLDNVLKLGLQLSKFTNVILLQILLVFPLNG